MLLRRRIPDTLHLCDVVAKPELEFHGHLPLSGLQQPSEDGAATASSAELPFIPLLRNQLGSKQLRGVRGQECGKEQQSIFHSVVTVTICF